MTAVEGSLCPVCDHKSHNPCGFAGAKTERHGSLSVPAKTALCRTTKRIYRISRYIRFLLLQPVCRLLPLVQRVGFLDTLSGGRRGGPRFYCRATTREPPNTADIGVSSSALSMAATSAAVRWMSAAPAFSFIRSTLRVPGIGTIQGRLQSIQASEICAGVPFFSAASRSSSASSRLPSFYPGGSGRGSSVWYISIYPKVVSRHEVSSPSQQKRSAAEGNLCSRPS